MLVFDFISAIAGSLKVLWFYWNYLNPVFIYSYLLLLWCKSRALGICVMQQSKQLSVLELMGSKKKQKTLFSSLYHLSPWQPTGCLGLLYVDAFVLTLWWMDAILFYGNFQRTVQVWFFSFSSTLWNPPSFLFLFDSNNNVTSFCWKWWNKLCTLSCFVLALQPNWKEFVKCTLLESV